ncbi:hypothetical protein [Veillonella agrestimuris]|uniref:hypothetical protein n=1 Tax=Veillonella agrestimuris TaxID=2941340 RepID=UPI00203D27D5|nr:hypothetical protein [Veillonella agrestimuris]
MSRWSRSIHAIQQEIKAFLFMTALIMLFRLLFIACYSYQLESTPAKEIISAIWLGFRISLKTVGFMTLLSILVISIPHVFRPTWPAEKLRNIWYGFLIVLSTFLFCGRIPFYYIFQSGYNIMLINGVYDDIGATIATAIHEYHAVPIFISAALISALLCLLFSRLMAISTQSFSPPESKKQWRLTIGIGTLLFFTIAIFFRFGGAFTYKRSIHWESAARTSSNLLNEAILDDMQALYRVKSIATRINKISNIKLNPSEIDERIVALGGNPTAPTIDEAFTKTIESTRLTSQPTAIYVILGESYGAWPLLDEYDDLGQYITLYGKRWVTSPHSIATTSALAPSSGTIGAVNGLLTGLTDTRMYPNYESVTYHDT